VTYSVALNWPVTDISCDLTRIFLHIHSYAVSQKTRHQIELCLHVR